GRYTQRIRDELAVGREVWIKLPYGEFIVENHLGEDGREAVIVAGGTGISPFLPLIEGIVDQERDPIRMQLYYGIREFGSILSRDLLIALNRFPECSVHLFVEQGIDESLG